METIQGDEMRFLTAGLFCGIAVVQIHAQTASTAGGSAPVVGILNYIHAVSNLEKTVAFYRDVLGLETAGPRPFPNPAVPKLTNAPGAELHLATMRIPNAGFGMELTDFRNVERKPGQANPTDPGAAALTLRVRDFDAAFAALKKSGAPIVSRSGQPVRLGDQGMRAVLARDPDGYLVALENAPDNVVSASMDHMVGDLEASVRFYRDLLGFEFTGKMDFTTDPHLMDFLGVPEGTQFRVMRAAVPGTSARMLLYEFRGVARTPFHLRVPDPGCPAVALRVNDLDGLLQRMKAAGVKLVSAGGEPQQFSPNIRNIFVEDPDGFHIELYQVYQH
jgi:catechol 2,3-dioxygenase-like lactoylglutathione lyase family enzyme